MRFQPVAHLEPFGISHQARRPPGKDLRRTSDIPPPFQSQEAENDLDELPDRMSFTRGDNKILRLGQAKDANHRIDVVRGISPIDKRIQVAQDERRLAGRLDGQPPPE